MFVRAHAMTALTTQEIQSRMGRVPGWELRDGSAIQKTFRFPTFAAAIRFVDKVAAIADAADHHPDILIRYDRVTLTLSTHDAHGLTERDFALAAEIENVAP
jgi:4a-hydroxytetrahydrobiopterin dehydratase